MKITLVTGGTGSTNIQKGFYEFIQNQYDYSLNLIINGYDDGKSTGVLRDLFPGTLGISDFRKNQILEYKLHNYCIGIYNLLNHRFTKSDYKLAKEYLIDKINETDFKNKNEIKKFLINKTKFFFETSQSKIIEYNDFSFANIIYCSVLLENNNDMEKTCKIIQEILELKNNIYVNSDENLILKAKTKNNIILSDEASIVDFDGGILAQDKIIDIFFDPVIPTLKENTKKLILESDIILFSSGTQFSSLIPTYKTTLFKEAILQSKAKKYLVLNCDYDNDIKNYSGDELLDKINEYLPLEDVQIIISESMNPKLIPTEKLKYKFINIPLLIKNKQHNGFLIWKYIFQDIFFNYFNKQYIFDYDYTIFDKSFISTSIDNLNILNQIENKIIVTNNCFSNLMPIRNTDIYSNISNLYNELEIVDNNYIISEKEIQEIYQILKFVLDKKDKYRITNRKNISISITPFENDKNNNLERDFLIDKFNNFLNKTNFSAMKTGKTTIEITKKGLCKRNTFEKKNFLNPNFTYITDTNDINYTKNDPIKYLQVDSIQTTNLFIRSLKYNKKYDFCIIVGGVNQRMNIDFPKCLIQVKNEIVLTKILRETIHFANNIYICASNYYKKYFVDYEKNMKSTFENFINLNFYYFNSIDESQSYPKGNGETIYQLIKLIPNLTSKLFILWGDIIFPNNNSIFEEIYNFDLLYLSDSNFVIPVIYENDPYAYLVFEEEESNKNKIKKIGYKKYEPIKAGYHDQCVFLINKNVLFDKLQNIIFKSNKNSNENSNQINEINFLDVVEKLDKVYYFETKNQIKSFNTFDELE